MRINPLLLLVPVLLVQMLTGTSVAETRAQPAAPPAIQAARADQALIESLIESGSVRTAPPRPSPSQYLRDQMTSLLDWIRDRINLSPRVVEILAQVITWTAVVLLGVTIGSLLVLLIRLWRSRSSARPPADGRVIGLTPEPSAVQSPEQCWQELQQALARERVGEALAALWWWLARSLAGAAAEASWTTRELLARYLAAGPARSELVRLCRRLDGMTYGPHRVASEAVQELAQQMRSVLS